MTGTIEINELILFARHGVYDFERENGNTFEITVHLHYPIENAMASDNLAYTLNYADAVEVIKQVMEKPSNLLEHVVQRLYESLTEKYPLVTGGFIRIAKLNPPINAEMKNVAVKIEW